jgi:hypothetical protein
VFVFCWDVAWCNFSATCSSFTDTGFCDGTGVGEDGEFLAISAQLLRIPQVEHAFLLWLVDLQPVHTHRRPCELGRLFWPLFPPM